MTEKEFDIEDKKITKEMLDEISKNYEELALNIPKPVYDKEGNLKNEKEIKSKIKKYLPTLLTLWAVNIAITERNSIKTMTNTNLYINTLKKAIKKQKTAISVKEWESIMKKTIKDRAKKIKIKQVINGNAKRLNKQVQNTVMTMYKNGKNYKQTAVELQKLYGYNENKAKSIAITEKNYYKSEAQLQAIDNISGSVKKIWIHNHAKEPRLAHLYADGQVADESGYFLVDGYKTKAPQHFGIPSEDINCHCTMKIEVDLQK